MLNPVTFANDQAEVRESNQIGETIGALQSVIERNAVELMKVKAELKTHRESLKSVFDNDQELVEATKQVKEVQTTVKTRKASIQARPEAISLKAKIGDLNERKKEIEETLSNHLVNYHQVTGSSSFDTSTGDQWDFSVSAKVKPKQLKLF